jgi:hypothetical protein
MRDDAGQDDARRRNNPHLRRYFGSLGLFRLEDVKKLIWPSFRDFSFDPKCMPTPQRSLIGHPGAIFFGAEFTPRF